MSKYISAYAAFEIGQEVYIYNPKFGVFPGKIFSQVIRLDENSSIPLVSYTLNAPLPLGGARLDERSIGLTPIDAINNYYDNLRKQAIESYNNKEKAANELPNASSTGA